MMKRITALLTALLLMCSVFLVSCGDNSTDELIEQIFEIEDIQKFWYHPTLMASTDSGIEAAIKYYEEYRETYPELIELEGKKNAVKKLLDFAEDCFAAEDSYGKGWSAMFILDREVFRGQMSYFERRKFEKLCNKAGFFMIYTEWFREKYPD